MFFHFNPPHAKDSRVRGGCRRQAPTLTSGLNHWGAVLPVHFKTSRRRLRIYHRISALHAGASPQPVRQQASPGRNTSGGPAGIFSTDADYASVVIESAGVACPDSRKSIPRAAAGLPHGGTGADSERYAHVESALTRAPIGLRISAGGGQLPLLAAVGQHAPYLLGAAAVRLKHYMPSVGRP